MSDPVDFTPLTDFYCKENATQYIRGLGYTAVNESLKQLVQQWLDEGKVVLGRRAAQIGGHGVVT